MYIYLQPIETKTQEDGLVGRSPRYEVGRWNLFDFGHTSTIGLVVTDQMITARDALLVPQTWTQTDRDKVGGFLRSGNIESGWVNGARDFREAWHRLLAMTQVYQTAISDPNTKPEWQDPSLWNGRVFHLGRGRKLLPLDMKAYKAEQDAKRWKIGNWWLYGREWVNQVTGQVVPMIAGGTLPATFDFTCGADTKLATLSSNFTDVNGEIEVFLSGQSASAWTVSTVCASRWNADTFDNDQGSQVVVSNLPSTYQQGAGVRMSDSAATFYYYMVCNAVTWNDRLGKVVAGSNTNLATRASNVAVNSDVVRIEASGTTITPLLNGSGTNTPGAQTDSAISSGWAGPMGNGSGSSSVTRMDDWEGGNLTAGTFQPAWARGANALIGVG